MSTRTPGRGRPVAITVSALALAATSVLPATARPAPVVYDALGDSYAAGSGASIAYPEVLDGRMRISLDDLAAVSGARIPTLLDTQLEALDAGTGLVTVSIGGNDIGWAGAVWACLIGGEQDCADAVGASAAAIEQQLPAGLDAAYSQIRAHAPGAHVVVTGYPRLFSPEHGDYVLDPRAPQVRITVAEQLLLNDGADLLNEVMAGVAGTHGFQFVDVTDRFKGHGVNAPRPWLTPITHPVGLHPNDQGQHAYGVALRAQIKPTSLR